MLENMYESVQENFKEEQMRIALSANFSLSKVHQWYVHLELTEKN